MSLLNGCSDSTKQCDNTVQLLVQHLEKF